jgi:hypothetical protein
MMENLANQDSPLVSSTLEDLTFSKFFHFQLQSSKLILNCNAIWVLIQWLIKQI